MLHDAIGFEWEIFIEERRLKATDPAGAEPSPTPTGRPVGEPRFPFYLG